VLPAVTVPCAWKAGFEFSQGFERGVGARTFVGGKDGFGNGGLGGIRAGNAVVTGTGISSSAKRPAACAATALR